MWSAYVANSMLPYMWRDNISHVTNWNDFPYWTSKAYETFIELLMFLMQSLVVIHKIILKFENHYKYSE